MKYRIKQVDALYYPQFKRFLLWWCIYDFILDNFGDGGSTAGGCDNYEDALYRIKIYYGNMSYKKKKKKKKRIIRVYNVEVQ